ncbi:hypothetical protein JQ557_00035 [Bradyrhizobium sp. U87765 SZCCT0131]|uniref:hypothetical protein n=1 Tax=unclassified Bradyrhizobium TaxID=2631580 RepID=UPI001BA9ADDA|nr:MULTISPECIES: hypothetical protein [unclassified Bradyrhizobium]MBR1216360.1 hypothetical protein [Bradyrhizobium sp. U87765 SZCCT0131]MBR1259892.1 hypothetical protein [Bradyrhizobium sp. U87765 SZCCT0134]MBR1306025.1 hypothetical protein [Bradyrhizobium sp. U87765 SZCCT0110]MBR1322392.1 hypothetical protein [Bradyrhizobium sp. U87765 SZCCT0109]MBR1352317.1 hypothetical protein [Bradyrhizobium sp. U87765 SZCCT0048]
MSSLDALTAFARAKLRARSPRLLAVAAGPAPDPSTPVVSPANYRNDFTAWNTLGLDLPQARDLARREAAGEPTGHPGLSFGLSTGTLGTPGVFIASQRDRARWLGTFLARVLSGGELLDFVRSGRVAVLLRHDSRLYHQTRTRTAFFPLGRGIAAVADGLAAFRPNIIVGPPFALRRIVDSAAFARDPWRVRFVVAGGEPLWPEDEAILRERLGPVRQVYQAAEGFFAASCGHGRLHLNADIVQFERATFIDAPDRFIPVVTDIARHGPQRLLRYRTDDIAIEATGPCPCGSVLPSIAAIEGRLSDAIVTPTGALAFPRAVYQAIAPALGGAPFRLVQDAPNQLTFHLPGDLPRAAISRAVDAARNCIGADVAVASLELPRLDDKFRRFERRMPLPEDFFAQRLREPTALPIAARNASRGR